MTGTAALALARHEGCTLERMSERLGARTILIVDEDEDARDVFALTFETRGLRTLCADSPDSALRLLETERVDAFLTSERFSKGSGTELIHRAVREGLLDPAVTRTAICSGSVRTPRAPHVTVLPKPVPLKRLFRALEGDPKPSGSGPQGRHERRERHGSDPR